MAARWKVTDKSVHHTNIKENVSYVCIVRTNKQFGANILSLCLYLLISISQNMYKKYPSPSLLLAPLLLTCFYICLVMFPCYIISVHQELHIHRPSYRPNTDVDDCRPITPAAIILTACRKSSCTNDLVLFAWPQLNNEPRQYRRLSWFMRLVMCNYWCSNSIESCWGTTTVRTIKIISPQSSQHSSIRCRWISSSEGRTCLAEDYWSGMQHYIYTTSCMRVRARYWCYELWFHSVISVVSIFAEFKLFE